MRDTGEGLLIERAKAFEPEALSELYRKHVDAIFRYVYYRVGDRAIAEDIVGEVFVRVLESLPSYQETGRPFEAWLYRIAQARVIDHYRRRKRRPVTPLDERIADRDEKTDPYQMAARRDSVRRTWEALNHLTEDQQHVICLRFIAGYSTTEVARLLEKTEGAVKALQHRALASLRRLLEIES